MTRDVVLVGEIGRDITAAAVVAMLAEPGPVRLIVDSVGGDHAATSAIYAAIRARPGVSVLVRTAASAAVLVALAADRRAITPTGRFLIHHGAAAAAGTASDLHRQAEALAELDAAVLKIIHERTGQDLGPALDSAGGELWINATQAVALGLVHNIEGSGEPAELPAEKPARAELVRRVTALRTRLRRADDATARKTMLEHIAAAGAVDPAYAGVAEMVQSEVGEAIEREGLAAVSRRADESLRRMRETTLQALSHARRQLRAHDLGGVPSRLPALPAWTCQDCGARNFHQPGGVDQLAECFTCR